MPTETKTLGGPVVTKWLETYAAAVQTIEDAGFPRLVGCPQGHLFDIPEIAGEASSFADVIRRRESKRQNRDVPVSYDLLLDRSSIVARVRF